MRILAVILFVTVCGTVDSRKDLVYFKAFLKKDTVVNRGTTLKFQDVVANTGHAYNPHSGVFTAPVSGIYMLSVILGTEGDGVGDFLIRNQGAIEAYISIQRGYEVGPMTILAHVKKGNHVFVLHGFGPSKKLRGWRLTQFSGLLIRAD